MPSLELTRAKVNEYDLSHFHKYVTGHRNERFFNMLAGQEHYRLLAYISSQLPPNSTVYDIGTYLGYSALALSYNSQVKVITYDITDHLTPERKEVLRSHPNIEYRIGDCINDAHDIVKNTKVVLIDVDPHDGIKEANILSSLVRNDFKGLIIFNDIQLNQEMHDFWTNLNIPGTKKIDATVCGHNSGTGLLVWDDSGFDFAINAI